MKSIRVITRLDVKGPNVVKGVHAEGLRVVGGPKTLAEKYYREGADEIVYMDIVASLYERNLDFEQLKSVCSNIFVPFTVGGGIRTLEDINNVLRAGADKVAINTYAIKHPSFLKEAAHTFGSQCIVLSVEAKQMPSGAWEAYTEGGRQKTGVDVKEWVKQAVDAGVGEVLLTSIDQDGTRKGYDTDLVTAVGCNLPIPVIVHGGVGKPEDMVEILDKTDIDAVSASSVYHYDIHTISDVKDSLTSHNIRIRNV